MSAAVVNAADLALLLGAWGVCPNTCVPAFPDCECLADLSDFPTACTVNAADLALLLGAWGPCP